MLIDLSRTLTALEGKDVTLFVHGVEMPPGRIKSVHEDLITFAIEGAHAVIVPMGSISWVKENGADRR